MSLERYERLWAVSFQFVERDASHPPINVRFSPTCASEIAAAGLDTSSKLLIASVVHGAEPPMPSVFGERSRRSRCERIS